MHQKTDLGCCLRLKSLSILKLAGSVFPRLEMVEKDKVGLPKKKPVFFGNFSQKGGGGHPISQNFCKITKSFLACQIHPKVLKHVFHTGGSNIWSILSIKVHLILSLSSSLREKNGLFWEFCPWGGGGSPIPKSKCQNSDKILTFFVKTKNDPYGLKCKINPKIFLQLRGSQKGGGAGGPPFGKNSQKIPFFFGSHTLMQWN